MERRKAFATAGAVSAAAFAAVLAAGANIGLFGLADAHSGPGHLKLVDSQRAAQVLPETQIVDVPVPEAAPPSPPPTTGSRPAAPAQGSSRTSSGPTAAVPSPTSPTSTAAPADDHPDPSEHQPGQGADD